MGNLEKALKYPFTGQGWGPKFFLGGILNVIAGALGFIPYVGIILMLLFSFFPLGYMYKIFRNHLIGQEEPLPEWGDWSGLFFKGVFVFLIGLGYGIIPGILYWLGKSLWYEGGFFSFLGVLFLIMGVGIGLVAFFLFPMALAFFASRGDFMAAFHWKGIVEKIWLVQKEYFVGWLASLILILALLFIQTQILFVGWVFYAFGFFYLCVAMAYLFGTICREGTSGNP
jgi:hypothetical protein